MWGTPKEVRRISTLRARVSRAVEVCRSPPLVASREVAPAVGATVAVPEADSGAAVWQEEAGMIARARRRKGEDRVMDFLP
jgi:hypothetical protein